MQEKQVKSYGLLFWSIASQVILLSSGEILAQDRSEASSATTQKLDQNGNPPSASTKLKKADPFGFSKFFSQSPLNTQSKKEISIKNDVEALKNCDSLSKRSKTLDQLSGKIEALKTIKDPQAFTESMEAIHSALTALENAIANEAQAVQKLSLAVQSQAPTGYKIQQSVPQAQAVTARSSTSSPKTLERADGPLAAAAQTVSNERAKALKAPINSTDISGYYEIALELLKKLDAKSRLNALKTLEAQAKSSELDGPVYQYKTEVLKRIQGEQEDITSIP